MGIIMFRGINLPKFDPSMINLVKKVSTYGGLKNERKMKCGEVEVDVALRSAHVPANSTIVNVELNSLEVNKIDPDIKKSSHQS